MKRIGSIGIAAALTLLGSSTCLAAGANVSLERVKEVPTLPPNCNPKIYWEDALPEGLELVARIGFRTGAWSTTKECGENAVYRQLKEQACQAGADIVKVTAETKSGLLHSCHHLKADLYRRAAEPAATAPAAAPAGASTGDKIARLKELQALRDQGALTDAEFQKLKQEVLAEPPK